MTTDKPQNNKDFLLNFAFVKYGEVYLHGMGDDGEEIRLCDYIALRATSEKGCERTPQDILDGACNECNCELAALNIAAIQAAELRHRLAELEDKIESGKMLELPCKVGDTIWILNDPYFVGEIFEMEVLEIHLTKKHIIVVGYHECETFEAISQFVFRTKEQAEARLKELQGE